MKIHVLIPVYLALDVSLNGTSGDDLDQAKEAAYKAVADFCDEHTPRGDSKLLGRGVTLYYVTDDPMLMVHNDAWPKKEQT